MIKFSWWLAFPAEPVSRRHLHGLTAPLRIDHSERGRCVKFLGWTSRSPSAELISKPFWRQSLVSLRAPAHADPKSPRLQRFNLPTMSSPTWVGAHCFLNKNVFRRLCLSFGLPGGRGAASVYPGLRLRLGGAPAHGGDRTGPEIEQRSTTNSNLN